MKANRKFVDNEKAMASAGGAGLIVVFIGVILSSVVGLYFTPTFASACEEASWAFNGSEFEDILDIIYLMVLPILWAVLFVFVLVGAGYGVFRMAKRL